MLPDFDENGYLPRGIHPSTLEEAATRFGSGSPERVTQTTELREFAEWAKAAGVVRLVVDGSFVTDRASPNDVDVVVLPGLDYPRGRQPASASGHQWPYLHVQVATDAADFEQWATQDFGLDRNLIPRGVVEILL